MAHRASADRTSLTSAQVATAIGEKARATALWCLQTGRHLRDSIQAFSRDDADLLAASVAFYTLLSLAPLVLIAVAVAGLVLGRPAAHEHVKTLLTEAMGAKAAEAVSGWVNQAAASGQLASLVGIVLALLTASRLGTVMRATLDRVLMLNADGDARLRDQVKGYLFRRAYSVGLVLTTGPLLLAVVASRALLSAFHDLLFLGSSWKALAAHSSQLLLSLSIVAAICAAVYRYVPSRRVLWPDALRGGALTSVLFNAGNAAMGLYLGRSGFGLTYGIAGSAVAVLLWLQFSATVFLLGAEFIKVRKGSIGNHVGPQQ